MKILRIKIINVMFFIAVIAFGASALTEETTTERMEASGNKVADSAKKTYRNIKDKTCEMVNGKLECAGKKLANKVRNASDEVGTKAKETANKVD